jgi:UDPglucose 6-dehydrogenase
MTQRPRLTVIGTGYLGATHAVCMAELGFEVLGLDVLPEKVEALQSGTVPFYEPGLPELLQKNLDSGRLRFTTSYEEVGAFGDVHFVCVGTPQKKGEYAADMSYVDAAFTSLLPHAKAGSLLVGKSTVPAGTAERLAEQIDAARGGELELAWNPEFLREGFAVEDTLTPDRLVFGVRSRQAEEQLRAAFQPVIEGEQGSPTPVVLTDFATAQLVKVAANAFLATKISFINAMAEVCEATGGDVTLLSKALSYDTRIGGRFLHAGPRLRRRLPAQGHPRLHGPRRRAGRRPGAVVPQGGRRDQPAPAGRDDRAGPRARRRRFGGMRVAGARRGVQAQQRRHPRQPRARRRGEHPEQGAAVCLYDPEAMDNARIKHPELGYRDSAVEAARGADIVLHLTEWSEFREMDPAVLSEVVSEKRIVDGRNALDPAAWRAAGWTYRALGRP